jgi:hypothetical protein
MLSILREYIEDNYRVIEYTKDGQTVSHVVKTPVQTEIPLEETLPVPPQETLEEKIARLEQQIQNDTLVQFDVLATIYEELLTLKSQLGG